MISDANKEISGLGKRGAIISSEVFWARSPERILETFPCLKDFRIVLYIRDQKKVILSHYIQKLNTPKFAFSANQFFINSAMDYDYQFQIGRWKKAFGANRVTVRIYDDVTNILVDFFVQLFDISPNSIPPDYFLQIKAIIEDTKTRQNIRQSPFQAISRVFFNDGDNTDDVAKKKALARVIDGLQLPEIELHEDLSVKITEYYLSSNQYVKDHYFPCLGRAELFP